MGINLDDITKGILAVAESIFLHRGVILPNLRALPSTRCGNLRRQRLNVGIGNADMEETTFLIL